MEELKKYSTRLPRDILHKLRIHCATQELSAETVVTTAIKKYLDAFEKTIYRSINENGTNATL